ncbi:MAG: hypothetical protein ACI35T_01165 [Alistipes sp.]
MKNLSVIFGLAAMLMTGCAADDNDIRKDITSKTYTLRLTSAAPVADGRTYHDGTTVLWNSTGEQMAVAISKNGEMLNVGSEKECIMPFPACSASEVAADGSSATFALTWNTDKYGAFPTATGSYRLHGFYPVAAIGNYDSEYYPFLSGNIRPDEVLIMMPDVQQPSADTFDPSADVMMAISQKAYTTLTDGMEIPMVYDRIVTHGKLTLTNLPFDASTIKAVKITAPEDKQMTGIWYIAILDKSQSVEKGNFNYVQLIYPQDEGKVDEKKSVTRAGNSMDCWFCTMPFEIAEGEQLALQIETTEGVATHTITARSGGIRFEKNKLGTLSVNIPASAFSAWSIEAPASVDVRGTEGATSEILVRANCDIYPSIQYSGDDTDWASVDVDYSYTTTDSDGFTTYRYVVTANENHTIDSRSCTVVITDYNSGLVKNVAVNQAAGEGDITIILEDDTQWVGTSVVLAGVRWYPVNCGFSKTQPFGRLYQWGRRYGLKYTESTPDYTVHEYTTTPFSTLHPENDVYYWTKRGDADKDWYTSEFEISEADEAAGEPTKKLPEGWVDIADNAEIGNPCPEGWRVPTLDELTALNDLFVSAVEKDELYHGKFSDGENTLLLPLAGFVDPWYSTGYNTSPYGWNSQAYYYSSTRTWMIAMSTQLRDLRIHVMNVMSGYSRMDTTRPMAAYSVRCVKSLE